MNNIYYIDEWKEILKCIFPEDVSQFSASECDQSDEETLKKSQTMWYYIIDFGPNKGL